MPRFQLPFLLLLHYLAASLGFHASSPRPTFLPFANEELNDAKYREACAKGCLEPFLKTIHASLVSGNEFERLANTCYKLREYYTCIDKIKKCQPHHLVRILTGGLHYMCIEHPEDFEELMECLDTHSNIAQIECPNKCNARKLSIGWIMQAMMKRTMFIQPSSDRSAPVFNPLIFRKITTEGCMVLQCYFSCLKTKFNSKCDGIGGSMLMDAVIRPFSALHASLPLSPLMNLAKLMAPIQCNFIMTDAGIASHSLDPKLYEALRKLHENGAQPLVENATTYSGSTPTKELDSSATQVEITTTYSGSTPTKELNSSGIQVENATTYSRSTPTTELNSSATQVVGKYAHDGGR